MSEEKERSIRSFVKRFLGDDDSERRETKEILASLLYTGDKAKTEVVRLLAKEVRGYIEALELHKDLHHLLTNYSLEINASFNLKPLAGEEQISEQEGEDDDPDQ